MIPLAHIMYNLPDVLIPPTIGIEMGGWMVVRRTSGNWANRPTDRCGPCPRPIMTRHLRFANSYWSTHVGRARVSKKCCCGLAQTDRRFWYSQRILAGSHTSIVCQSNGESCRSAALRTVTFVCMAGTYYRQNWFNILIG